MSLQVRSTCTCKRQSQLTMSNPVVQTRNDSAGKTVQSMHSYHSAWMAHWTKRSYDPAIQSRISSSSSFGKGEHDHDNQEYQSMTKLEIAPDICGPAKGVEKIGTGTSKVTNESLRWTSTAVRNGNLAFHCFPTDNPCQNGGSSSGLKDSQETCNPEVTRPQIKHKLDFDVPTLSTRRSFFPSLLPMAPNANDTSSRECHSEPDGASQNAKEPVKTLAVFRDGGFTMSRPWPVDFTASTSHIMQCGFDQRDHRKNLLPSHINSPASASKEQLQDTNLRFLGRDYQRHSAILVCEEKIESESKTERSETCLQQNKASFLHTNPSTRNNHSPAFGGEQFQNVQNFSGFRLFQNHSKLPEAIKAEKLHHDYSSLPKFLRSIHDMETMRICTTVDSVVGVQGGHPRFSQTTHSLFITNKTDFDLNKENQTFSISRGSASGNAFSDLHNLSPAFPDGKKGVELQTLGVFSESEVEENAENVNASTRFRKAEDTNVEGVKAFGKSMEDKGKKVEHDVVFDSNLKNESSAETDIMELDEFEENNQLSGVNSSPSNKVIKLGSIVPRLALGSTREVGDGHHNSELHDMNLELPALPAAGKMLDSGDPSTSRTQSLDMETLLAHAEPLRYSESEHFLGGSAKLEPSCPWVKRLKLSASDSCGAGTKSLNLGPPREKNNLVLARNLKGSIASSEPTVNRCHGKELMVLEKTDKTTALPRRGESFSSETDNKGRDSLLSHSWIQRWRHCQAATPEKKPESVVVCEPQSSKLASEDLQKKQFPSIAAMALMGKAMSGFQPCEFQKKGPFVVWNTRSF